MQDKRNDLQGLRAWAVLAVVIFHFFPSLLPYGFLGVDVFFVLSGFLITKVLAGKNPRHSSTYADFYFKRARRILPLLTALIFVLLVYICAVHQGQRLVYETKSAFYALILHTNLKGQDNGEDYFRQLEKAEDVFAHTWSLAVEFQFYLFAPLLLIFTKNWFDKFILHILTLISFTSFVYHCLSPPMVSFNSTFSRLWQFLLGSIAYELKENHCSNLLQIDDYQFQNKGTRKHEAIICAKEMLKFNYTYISVACAFAIMILFILSHTEWKTVVRFIMTVLAAIIVQQSFQCIMLTHPVLVTIGDISYSLYLIHWPFYCLMMEAGLASVKDRAYGIIFCVIMSFLAYEFFERRLNNVATFELLSADLSEGNRIDRMLKQWALEDTRNITLDQAMTINTEYEKQWDKMLVIPNCTMKKRGDVNPYGLCEAPKGNGKLTILVLGNSYTASYARLFMEHLQQHYSTLHFHSQYACEFLITTDLPGCVKAHSLFWDAIDTVKPDVVFIVQRWFKINDPINSIITVDPLFVEITKNLKKLEQNVSKVFILQPLPLLKDTGMEKNIEQKKPPKEVMQDIMDLEASPLKSRLVEVAKVCKKCILFDLFNIHLNKEKKFMAIHPHTHLQFFERCKHHTPYGIRLIAPMFEKLNKHFSRLIEGHGYPDNVLEW